ncbi:hypothetical protein GQX74_002164 [Glossina fuscipes]|nr:hypothetical protein GQX74_002164 [Glossina fuscipes]
MLVTRTSMPPTPTPIPALLRIYNGKMTTTTYHDCANQHLGSSIWMSVCECKVYSTENARRQYLSKPLAGWLTAWLVGLLVGWLVACLLAWYVSVKRGHIEDNVASFKFNFE